MDPHIQHVWVLVKQEQFQKHAGADQALDQKELADIWIKAGHVWCLEDSSRGKSEYWPGKNKPPGVLTLGRIEWTNCWSQHWNWNNNETKRSIWQKPPSALSQAAEVKVGKVSAEEAAFIEQSVKDLRESRCVDTPVTLTWDTENSSHRFEGSVVNDMILLSYLIQCVQENSKNCPCVRSTFRPWTQIIPEKSHMLLGSRRNAFHPYLPRAFRVKISILDSFSNVWLDASCTKSCTKPFEIGGWTDLVSI